MHICSALTANSDVETVSTNLCDRLGRSLGNHSADLLVLFVTTALKENFQGIVEAVEKRLKPKRLLACTAESVLGEQREVEKQPAAAALAMSLPGVTVDAFHFADEEWPELLGESGTLLARLEAGADLRAFLMLGDPYSTPIVQLLDACSMLFPNAPIIGGMASGMREPGEARLAINGQIFNSGLVGLSVAGPIQVDCVVSQGCRPIGQPFVITKAHQNVIEQLGGKPAIVALEEMLTGLSLVDRQLLQTRQLQVGRVIDEGKGNFGRGDFLIRTIMGVQRESGGIAIGDMVRPGQTVQFHVQDARAADEDLRLLLQGEIMLANTPAGALMFSCNGRGTQLFGAPDHDIRALHQVLGDVPVAGFFCAGEFGPVGGRNFIHGQTASLALFRKPE